VPSRCLCSTVSHVVRSLPESGSVTTPIRSSARNADIFDALPETPGLPVIHQECRHRESNSYLAVPTPDAQRLFRKRI
jgi:hypothetical protein